jgi:hypothetical protein
MIILYDISDSMGSGEVYHISLIQVLDHDYIEELLNGYPILLRKSLG